MDWRNLAFGAAALAVLWLMVRSFRGLGAARQRAEKDSADLWLHADTTPPKPAPDAPTLDRRDEGEGD